MFHRSYKSTILFYYDNASSGCFVYHVAYDFIFASSSYAFW